MTEDTDTVPISEVGIGDDETEEQLDEHADIIASVAQVVTATVESDILAGVAHIHVTLVATQSKIPPDLQNYIIAEGLHMFDPHINGDGALQFRLTTGDVYETWGGMESPELPNNE